MISTLRTLNNARPNLKITNFIERFRGVSSGIPVRCSKKDPQDTKEVKDEKTKKEQSNEYPEEPSVCCMSGCANCVWLEYAQKLTEYYKDGGEKAVKEIEEKVTDPNIKAFLMHELRMRNIKPK